jgi:hypothetical protein
MSADTLLTRAEVEEWPREGDPPPLVEIDEHQYSRLLRTVDTAHGVLRDEMNAALKQGFQQMIHEANERAEKAEAVQHAQEQRCSELLAEAAQELAVAERELAVEKDKARLVWVDFCHSEETRVKAEADLEAERRDHARTRERLAEAETAAQAVHALPRTIGTAGHE